MAMSIDLYEDWAQIRFDPQSVDKSLQLYVPKNTNPASIRVESSDNIVFNFIEPDNRSSTIYKDRLVCVSKGNNKVEGRFLSHTDGGIYIGQDYNTLVFISKPEAISTKYADNEQRPLITDKIYTIKFDEKPQCPITLVTKDLTWKPQYILTVGGDYIQFYIKALITRNSKYNYCGHINFYAGGKRQMIDDSQIFARQSLIAKESKVSEPSIASGDNDVVYVMSHPQLSFVKGASQMVYDDKKCTMVQVPYAFLYKHYLGTQTVSTQYQFIAPRHLIPGEVQIYDSEGLFVGASTIKQTLPNDEVFLTIGISPLRIFSKVTIEKIPSVTEKIVTTTEVGENAKQFPLVVSSKTKQLEEIATTEDKPLSQKYSISAKIYNNHDSDIMVRLVYNIYKKIISVDPEPVIEGSELRWDVTILANNMGQFEAGIITSM